MNLFAKLLELKFKVTHRVALVSLLMLCPTLAALAATCPTGYVSSTVQAQEYSQWSAGSFNSMITAAGSSTNLNDDVVITGSMTQNGTSQSINGAVNARSPVGGAVFITQDMRSRSDTNTITYKFNKPLLNLSLSVYDIDRQFGFFTYNWKDRVQFIAKNTNDENVLPVFSNEGEFVSASGDTASGDSPFFTFGTCSNNDFSNSCKVTASFDSSITELKVVYGNTNDAKTNPDDQNIEMTFDDFCVKLPTYTFSGTVFNDNGGITSARANATNADITTSTSPYANNSNYFNGIFDPSAPNAETGIAGSTVELVNCDNTATVYSAQTVAGTPIGQYQLTAPISVLNGDTNICLVEERSGNTYPIRTTDNRRTVGFAATTYNYPNNNFGRVIAENVALVLKKYQYINNCPPNFNYTSINESTSPSKGFSTASIENINPGKCIAYKITATNRANINIDNFVMKDVLQKKGVSSAIVTSVLANPVYASGNYASDSVAIGQNGTVKTKPLTLMPRAKRDFYFNTKYGTTVTSQ